MASKINGNGIIDGTYSDDIIKGGSGDDTITGSYGNDTITGGTGANTIIYYAGDGNDVINLTKGENFTLDMQGFSDIGELNFEFVKSDLRIYTQKNEYITIKNFVSKDVTNNSNSKKGTEDTSSVELKIGDNTYDLRKYLYKIDALKNYTGSWLNEEIDASSATLGKNNKGVTIKGLGGDDVIIGSKGNDTITGGTGKNLVKYSNSNGNDIINLTKGENFTLELTDITNIDELKFEFVASNSKVDTVLSYFFNTNSLDKKSDLRIYTKTNEYITIKNFVSKDITNNSTKKTEDTSSVELKIGDNTYDLREYLYKLSVLKNYTGSWLNEEIDTSSASLGKNNKGVTIKGLGGDDVIIGSKGNDTITGGTGKNLVKYSNSNGNDIINLTKGENFTLELNDIDSIDNIKFEFVKNDLRIYTQNNEYITIKNFVNKDVTNNSTKKTEDTSSVELKIGDNTYDLREYLYKIDVFKNYTGSWLDEEIDASKYIAYNKKGMEIYTNTKGLSINSKAGDDIVSGSKYNDTIKGGNGDDTITGGKGNDKLYGEAGSNTFIFNEGDGKDTVYSGKGEDTLEFNVNFSDVKFEQVKNSKNVGTKDLIITYGENDTVTIKDYFTIDKKGNITGTKSSVKNISTAEGTFDIEEARNGIVIPTKILTDKITVDAGNGNDTIDGGNYNNYIINNSQIDGGSGNDVIRLKGINNSTITGGNGNDYIICEGYNNTIAGGTGNDCIIVGPGVDFDKKGNNTVVFNNGDGNDIINRWYGYDNDLEYYSSVYDNKVTLKFNDSVTSDFKLEKSGYSLIIKYNSDKDSVTIANYYDKETGTKSESSPDFTIEDKDGNKTTLNDFITAYGDIPNSQNMIGAGTDSDDDIRIYNLENKIINAGKGNDLISNQANNNQIDGGAGKDYIESTGNNNTIVGGADNDRISSKGNNNNITGGTGNDGIGCNGNDNILAGNDGNDTIQCRGNNNTIVGGTGNDYIYITNDDTPEGSTTNNVVVLNNGDGNDTIYADANTTLKFNDSLNSDFKFEKFGSSLVIKYNSDKDSITIQNYFDNNVEKIEYIIEDKNGIQKTLTDFLSVYKGVPTSNTTTITGTDINDYINVNKDNLTVNASAGNDEIECNGKNNTIVGGTGNDYFSLGEFCENNTLIFNNGDGNDTIDGYDSDITLKFNDSVTSDFKLEKFGNDLIIKYNTDKDSITISDYYDEETGTKSEYAPSYTIEDKNGNKTTLDDFIKAYTTIPTSTITEIVGTDTDDYIYTDKNNLTIDTGKGDDDIRVYSNNNKVYGGAGNDNIECYGDNNTIIGGTGNDEIHVSIDYSEIEKTYNNTVVFNNGDGNDTLNVWNSDDNHNVTLKFNDSVTSDFKLEKFGNDLIIKYNSDKDRVTVSDFYDEETGMKSEYAPSYTIEDKNGKQTALDDFISSYGDIPTSTITEIVGTDTDDYIYVSGNTPSLTINGGKGDDDIRVYSNNNKVYGGAGNDNIECYGDNNTIIGGTGNDEIHVDIDYSEIEKTCNNTVVFNNGDGNDTLNAWNSDDNHNVTLKFNDSVTSDFKLEKFGNDLIIKYNTDKDSITISDYYDEETGTKSEWAPSYTIEDKNGKKTNLDSFVSSYGNIPTVAITTITGTDTDDYIYVSGNTPSLTINGGKGDDDIRVYSNNNKVYGGAGNDNIECYGDNNTIIGGTGNDEIHVSIDYSEIEKTYNNTVVFNNGDGNDTLNAWNSDDNHNVTLKFNDSVTSDFKLEKFGSSLVIKYNSDKDSVTIGNYYDEETGTKSEYAPNYTIEDKNGNKTTLDDFIKAYTTIPTSTTTTINGTDINDYINVDKDNLTINAGKGNDEIECSGKNNTIIGGTGNDYISLYVNDESGENNTLIFNNGDGNDTISSWNAITTTLKFNDSVTSDFKLEKFGNDLIIKYNSDKDSVTIEDYFYTEGEINEIETGYTIEDKNGNKTSLDEFIKNYISIPTSTTKTITGTDTDDYIYVNNVENITINAGKGDDKIDLWGNNNKLSGDDGNDIIYGYGNNNTIIGGAGNDEIDSWGNNNTIIGGTGNDRIYVYDYDTPEGSKAGNIAVFNNDDGNDTINGYDSDITLKFNDSVTSDFKLEKFGNDLIIKYNTDKDSITISSYFYTNEETGTKSEWAPSYTIEDKSGNKTTLDDFVSSYGDIPTATETEIVGTDADDYISLPNIPVNTTYNAQINKSYIIDDVEGKDVLFVENTSKDTSVNVVFDITNNYTTEDGIEFGDILLLDNSNFEKWKANKAFNGITIKNNAIETINSSNGYSITSEKIAQLAQDVASWLSTNDFADVSTALTSGTKDQVAELTAYFTKENNWSMA